MPHEPHGADSAHLNALDRDPGDGEGQLPGAGPHAFPELTDDEKTPGCGMLPEPGDPNVAPSS
nr:hypothetical protein [Bradyrhizobium sp. 149]